MFPSLRLDLPICSHQLLSATMKATLVILFFSAASSVLAFAPVSGGKDVQRRPSIPSSPLSAYYVDIDESANRDIGSMDEWARNCGVQSIPGFQLTTEDGRDWSVMTTENIEAGGPIVRIPEPMILSAFEARQELEQLGNVQEALELLGRLDKNAAKDVNQFYLFLKILVELERGDGSPWFPWLNALPRAYSNGPSMTPFCFECLPPLVSTMAKEERSKFIFFCQALKQVNFLSDQVKNDVDLARFAYNAMFTRSFKVDGDEKIVPMGDMVRTYTADMYMYSNSGMHAE